MRRSQADHSVAGCSGSVHPCGHPISQSEKLGLKVRSPVEYLPPGSNFKWSRCEERDITLPVGRPPQLLTSSHIMVQSRAALPIEICDPIWVGSSLSFIPAAEISSSTLLV